MRLCFNSLQVYQYPYMHSLVVRYKEMCTHVSDKTLSIAVCMVTTHSLSSLSGLPLFHVLHYIMLLWIVTLLHQCKKNPSQSMNNHATTMGTSYIQAVKRYFETPVRSSVNRTSSMVYLSCSLWQGVKTLRYHANITHRRGLAASV